MADQWPPDPPIARAGTQLARDLYGERLCQCNKCGDRFPESQTVARFPAAPWVRICLECRKESDVAT